MSSAKPSDVVHNAKAQIIKQDTNWFNNNDVNKLYSGICHVERVKKLLKFTEHIQGRVLDIGCFEGFVTEQILNQGGKEVIGMDRLEKALGLAEKRGLQTILADIDDAIIDSPDNYFDCIVMGGVLNYVYDPDAVIEEVYRVLKLDGKLIITVPNLTSFRNRIRMGFGLHPFALEIRPGQGGYLRYFTFETLQELLSDHDFETETIQSNVVAFPFVRKLPGVRRYFPGDEWEYHRIFFSKFLVRIFPRMGEKIIVLAKKAQGKSYSSPNILKKAPENQEK